MATNVNMWLTVTRLRDKIASIGHAAPIFMGFVRLIGGSFVFCDTPLFAGAEGLSVPISRGSPPTPD
jgi:hypothetical protein